MRDRRILAICTLAVVSLAALLLLPPIAQDQSYHQFADQRTFFGVPHFSNVVSNFPFILIGAAGLWRLLLLSRRNACSSVIRGCHRTSSTSPSPAPGLETS